jgi:hypothetical protein
MQRQYLMDTHAWTQFPRTQRSGSVQDAGSCWPGWRNSNTVASQVSEQTHVSIACTPVTPTIALRKLANQQRSFPQALTTRALQQVDDGLKDAFCQYFAFDIWTGMDKVAEGAHCLIVSCMILHIHPAVA